jgi:hypothetical protein
VACGKLVTAKPADRVVDADASAPRAHAGFASLRSQARTARFGSANRDTARGRDEIIGEERSERLPVLAVEEFLVKRAQTLRIAHRDLTSIIIGLTARPMS